MIRPLKMISDSKLTLLAGKRICMHTRNKMNKVSGHHIWILVLLTGIFIFFGVASSYASTDLTVMVPATATEGNGVLVDVGTVTALEVPDFDLVVDLISDDTSEVAVPAAVTIPGGQTSATFDLTIINDEDIDGIQTVTISASAAGWTVGTAAINIEDNDPGLLQFSSDSYTIDENSGSANITIVRTQSSSGTITVDYATHDDTATAGSDYNLTTGTLTFGDGETEKSFAVNIIDDDFVEVDETVILSLSNPGGGALLGSVATSGLTIISEDSVDYFTEQFNGENDLNFQSLTFMPNGSGSFYSVCRQETDVFPTSPDGGIILALSDDSFQQITLTGGEHLSFYGVNYSEFFVGSNGYITFDSGDSDYSETLSEHFSQPRISGLYNDLNPGDGGTVSWKQLVDRVVVTYLNIPEYGASNQNSFQVELFFDGTIRTTYLQIDTAYGITGLSAGNGHPEDFQESDLSGYDLCFLISLPESVTEGDGVLFGQGIVSLPDSTAGDLLVNLSVDDPSEITLPATVTIPAGQNSAVFDITVEDDIILDGSQAVTITASTAGNPVALATVWVHDNETTTLSLNIPSTASEGDGVLAGQGSLFADTPVESDVAVNLVSDDPTEATVLETVTLLTGQNSATFDLVIVDDTEIDGLQTATITASVAGWTSGDGTIEVQDNETQVLTITLPAIVNEGDGLLVGAGSVILSGTPTSNLVVDLSSDDESKATVPATVTIPAGHVSAVFDIIIVDDTIIETEQMVTITVSASGWTSDSSTIIIFDDELLKITTSDNENNNGTGIPDNDMDKNSPPCIYNTSSTHPIEFNINVDGPLPVSSSYLSLFIEDIDWPAEQDEVFLNGHSLGFAIGENNLNYSTLFVIPDLSWVQSGNNLVQIYVDRNNVSDWCAMVHSGQLIFDNNAEANTAIIRSATSDFAEYNFGDIVSIDLEVDTALSSQDVRLELLLRDPTGRIFDFDANDAARYWTIHGNNDEPYQWIFTLPVSGNDGLWGVSISVYDIATQRFENKKSITFSVPLGAANVPTINSISPNSGPALEATPVVISGTNFIEGETNCVVGGWSIDNLTVVDNVTITGNTSPSLIVGSHEAACTTIHGTGTLSDAFTVIGPKITSSLLDHNFGEIYLNDTTAYSFTLSNTGNAELAIETISMTGTDASVFSISNDSCSGQTLLPSETCTVDVLFLPAIFGSKHAYLSIPSNDPHTPLFNVPITGTGIVEVDLTTASQNVSEEVGTVTITATLNTFSSEDIMIPYTVSGTAIGGGTDHNLADGTITIPAGQASATVTFDVVDDALNENDETVIVTVGTPVNARAGVVTIHTIIIVDDDPPEDVTNLKAASYENRLVFTWTHSANTSGDLAGYKVYFNGATEGVVLSAAQNTYEEAGLNPATGYPITVTAYDNDGYESAGVSIAGVTILPNPASLSATANSGYVDLSWDGVQPSQYVRHYLVYVSDTDFSSVEGMTPRRATGSTTANVAGLTNNTTYYFAATTVNISDGEQTTVSTIPATPVPDTQGPDITDVKIDNILLLNGHTITKPCTFTASAEDPASVSRVEFYFDGNLICTDFNPEYVCYLNTNEVDDGPHTLTIVAFDTLGNSTTVERTVVVTLDPPAAPTITEPAGGTVTNQPVITVSGIAEKYTEAILYNNSMATGDTARVDSLGKFSFSLPLVEGENRIQAAA
ncbi:MAG: choice-of-anchor D domain-containing protein, partial [Deltaproteobacteria bacterium]|nr:choice-of-anchor D domain-containing protein [Deltaproteobacteria bacterium]